MRSAYRSSLSSVDQNALYLAEERRVLRWVSFWTASLRGASPGWGLDVMLVVEEGWEVVVVGGERM